MSPGGRPSRLVAYLPKVIAAVIIFVVASAVATLRRLPERDHVEPLTQLSQQHDPSAYVDALSPTSTR